MKPLEINLRIEKNYITAGIFLKPVHNCNNFPKQMSKFTSHTCITSFVITFSVIFFFMSRHKNLCAINYAFIRHSFEHFFFLDQCRCAIWTMNAFIGKNCNKRAIFCVTHIPLEFSQNLSVVKMFGSSDTCSILTHKWHTLRREHKWKRDKTYI